MTSTTDRTALIAEALKINDNHYNFCTPGCPRGDHDHQPSLTARLVAAVIELKREIDEQAVTIQAVREWRDWTCNLHLDDGRTQINWAGIDAIVSRTNPSSTKGTP